MRSNSTSLLTLTTGYALLHRRKLWIAPMPASEWRLIPKGKCLSFRIFHSPDCHVGALTESIGMNNFTPAVIRILRKNGWEFLRHGDGDHDIWWNPGTRRKVNVDSKIKSRHSAKW